jgi:hypothetical protein
MRTGTAGKSKDNGQTARHDGSLLTPAGREIKSVNLSAPAAFSCPNNGTR